MYSNIYYFSKNILHRRECTVTYITSLKKRMYSNIYYFFKDILHRRECTVTYITSLKIYYTEENVQ